MVVLKTEAAVMGKDIHISCRSNTMWKTGLEGEKERERDKWTKKYQVSKLKKKQTHS